MLGDPIAGLRSTSGALISVFANRPSPGGFAALLSDLVRPLREQASHRGRLVEKSVRGDTTRIRDLAPQLEADSAPAYALFVSSLDDVFILEPLPHPCANVASLGPRPYMRPLRAAPKGLRAGVLVADQEVARTFVGYAGHIEEVGEALVAAHTKANYGGFLGYDEHNVRGQADESAQRLWKEAGWRLLEAHQDRPFDYLAVGSKEEAFEAVGRSLHPYLAGLHRMRFAANPVGLNVSLLRSELRALDERVRTERHEALAGRVCDTAWSGGNGVVGLAATLDAVNAQAVDTLVVAGEFSRDGALCNECGHLARNGPDCPVCGAILFAVDDVVGSAMDAVVGSGGTVYQLVVASPLDQEGVGALTRFPVAVRAN